MCSTLGVTAPEGTSLPAMEQVMKQLDQRIRNIRGVELTLTTAGGGFIGNVNSGDIYVRIAPHDERSELCRHGRRR